MHNCVSAQHYCQQYSRFDIPQAVNEDGVLAWTQVTVLRSFQPQLPDTPFLRMTTAAGQVCTNGKVSPHGAPEKDYWVPVQQGTSDDIQPDMQAGTAED